MTNVTDKQENKTSRLDKIGDTICKIPAIIFHALLKFANEFVYIRCNKKFIDVKMIDAQHVALVIFHVKTQCTQNYDKDIVFDGGQLYLLKTFDKTSTLNIAINDEMIEFSNEKKRVIIPREINKERLNIRIDLKNAVIKEDIPIVPFYNFIKTTVSDVEFEFSKDHHVYAYMHGYMTYVEHDLGKADYAEAEDLHVAVDSYILKRILAMLKSVEMREINLVYTTDYPTLISANSKLYDVEVYIAPKMED